MNATLSPRSPCDRGDAVSPCSPSFYGVYLGLTDPNGEGTSHVFDNKLEALKIAKKCKKSRFKAFCSFEEAENFSLNGPDLVTSPGTPVAAEKSSSYKAPVSQSLVKFRKLIEKGNFDEVILNIQTNPWYLVSSGDTPAILQEGARYNALHIAAKFNQYKIAEYVLKCVTDPEFIQKLYGEDKIKDTVQQRCDVLLDLYLNTPDKAANETPLHFASKMGAVDVVKTLVSYNRCVKSMKNKEGLTPLEIVGSRKTNISLEDKNEIIRLLSSEFYIAVYRPWHPVRPPILEGPFQMASVSKTNLESFFYTEMHMSGVAGPMEYEEAIRFKKMWKRPRGSPLASPGSPCSPPPPIAFSPSSFKQPDKVIERIGRELSAEMGVHWVEYWPFLKDFANFQKESDIDLLEKHLKLRFGSANQTQKKNNQPKAELDNLSVDFSNLLISELSSSDPKNNNLLDLKVSNKSCYWHIDKTCQVYANKLVESLASHEPKCFHTALKRCQDLLMSCAQDERYVNIEFNRIHSKLAALANQRVYDDNSYEISSCVEFLKSFIKYESASLNSSTLCICKKILNAFIENNMSAPTLPSRGSNKSNNEEYIKSLWLSLEACKCSSSDTKVKPFKKRLDFWSRFREQKIENLDHDVTSPSNNCIVDNNENKMMVEDCESDDCYNTPPNSPGSYRSKNDSTNFSSEGDSSSEDEMYSADEGGPISIEGDELTDADRAVYEALDESKVVSSKHPLTYLWIQDCKRKFQSSNLLIFSPLSPVYKKKCEEIKLSLRDSFSNSPSK